MFYKFKKFFGGRSFAHKIKYTHVDQRKSHHDYILMRKHYYKKFFTLEELKLEELYIKHKVAGSEQNVGPLYWYIFSIFFSASLTFLYYVPKKIEDKLIYQVVDNILQQEGERIAQGLLNNGKGIETIIESLEKMQDIELLYEGSVYQLFYIGIDIILFLFFGIISTLMGYGFFYRRRIASLKFNLMVVQTVIEEIENGQSE